VFDLRVDRLAADVVVIVAVGEIDAVTAPKLSASLHRELEHAPSALVLDLTGVSFLGVAGLHVLDCALARAETLSVTLNLVHHDHSAVQSALRAAAMTGLFPTYRTVDLARAPSSGCAPAAADQRRVG
jgi:anti-sigma B factor antagonist